MAQCDKPLGVWGTESPIHNNTVFRPFSPFPVANSRTPKLNVTLNQYNLHSIRFLRTSSSRITNKGAEYVAHLSSLEALVLSDSQIDDAGLESLKPLTRLKSLSLKRTRITDKGIKALTVLPLTACFLDGNTTITDEGAKTLSRMKSLNDVGLDGTAITDRGLEYLGTLPNLQTLHLDGLHITDDGLAYLAASTTLSRLWLNGADVTGTGFHGFQGPIHTLYLQNAKVDDKGLEAIGQLTQLSELYLDGAAVTDKGLQYVEALGNLTQLRLNGTRVGNDGLVHLRGLKKLRNLWLGNTKVNDEGLKNLQPLRLGILSLPKTRVTDSGLEFLKQIKTLKSLDLTATGVTLKGIASIKKAIPKCDVRADDVAKNRLPNGQRLDGSRDIYLSVKDTSWAKWIWTNPRDNANINGSPLKAGSVLFQNGIGIHSPMELDFSTGGKYRWLTFYAGIADYIDRDGSIKIQVWLDGKQVFESRLLRANEAPLYVRVPIDGARMVRIVGTNGGNGNHSDHTCLGNLRLCVGPTEPVPDGPWPPDRLATLVLKAGGEVTVKAADGKTIPVSTIDALPKTPCAITELRLADAKGVDDAWLAKLAGLSNLEFLKLTNLPITGQGLKHLTGLKKLKTLGLGGTQVGDDLAALEGLSIEKLDLRGMRVTDKAVEHMKKLKSLKGVWIDPNCWSAAARQELKKTLPDCSVKEVSAR